MEPTRPRPDEPIAERLRGWVRWFGLGRLVAAAVSVAVVAFGGWWLLHAPPPPIEQSLPLAVRPTAPPTTGGASTATAGLSVAPPMTMVPPVEGAPSSVAQPVEIVVQIAGEVAVPGVYRLPDGARIVDLVAAAGGATPDGDPDALSLAGRLVDGDRVRVPRRGEVTEAPIVSPNAGAGRPPSAGTTTGVSSGSAAAGAPAGPVDLNRAGADELDALPGVGPATAAAIVAHREQNGPFASVDDLLDVRGIGPAKLDAIRPLVTV